VLCSPLLLVGLLLQAPRGDLALASYAGQHGVRALELGLTSTVASITGTRCYRLVVEGFAGRWRQGADWAVEEVVQGVLRRQWWGCGRRVQQRWGLLVGALCAAGRGAWPLPACDGVLLLLVRRGCAALIRLTAAAPSTPLLADGVLGQGSAHAVWPRHPLALPARCWP